MLYLIRHLVSIAVLPFTVTVIIPRWIALRYAVQLSLGADAAQLAIQAAGVAAAMVGLWLFGESLRLFATRGRGTLAPWDPPRNLVVEGPYRYVRNPMISGVIFILFAEALVLRSWPHARWALLFLAINAVYIPLLEEPMLEARFGASYEEYRHNVRRFIPRLHPWMPRARV